MQAMDVQIDELTSALAESDLKQVEFDKEREKTRRDLESSKNKLSYIAAELCEKEINVKNMSSQIDECSLYIQKFKTLCCEQLSPSFYNMKQDLAIVDTHVKLVESVCKEKSIMTHQLQCTIETMSSQYQHDIASTKNIMYEQAKTHEHLVNRLEKAEEITRQFEKICQDGKREIQDLELRAVDNNKTTIKQQYELDNLTAKLSLKNDENNQQQLEIRHLTANTEVTNNENTQQRLEIKSFIERLAIKNEENTEQKLEIEYLIIELKKATDKNKYDSEQIGKIEIELAKLKSNETNNILIGMQCDEDKILYKSNIDNEILVCLSQKQDLDTEIKILVRDLQTQRELLLIETSNNDMMEIEITVCKSQLIDMKQKIEQLTARKEELSNCVIVKSIQHDDIVQKLETVQASMEEVNSMNAVAQSEYITLSEILSQVKLEHREFVTETKTNAAFFAEEKLRIHITIQELQHTESQLVKNIEEHTGVLTRLRSNKEDTKHEIVEMRHEHSKITVETDELKQNLQTLKIEYESACTQNDIIIAQKSVVSETLASMYTQLGDQSQMLSKKTDLLNDISDFMQQLNSLKTQTVCVSEHCDNLHKQNIEREEECTRLTSSIERHSEKETLLTAEICKLDKTVCLLQQQERDFKKMLSDYEVVQEKNQEALQQKHDFETDIDTLRNLKLSLCLEIAELEGNYEALKVGYATKTDHVTTLNQEITRVSEYLEKCKFESQNVICLETKIEDLMEKKTIMLAETKNYRIEIQQLIKVIEEHQEEKINLNETNTSIIRQISTQSEKFELLTRNIETNTVVKIDLEQEICVLTTQLKDLLLSEQKLIHTQNKMDELVLQKSKIDLENQKQKSEHQRITTELQDMGEKHEALEIRLNKTELELHQCEKKMADILLLVQEQQLKKQQIDMDVDVSVKMLEDSLASNEEIYNNHSNIELEHITRIQELSNKHTESEYNHSLIMQNYEESHKEYQLEHEKIKISLQELKQEISIATTHKEEIENQILEKQGEFTVFKNKLLVVDAYSAHMEIVVHEIHKLVQNEGVNSCAESNSRVLGELILLVMSFLEWFETTFIYKLHILSNMMLNSQV